MAEQGDTKLLRLIATAGPLVGRVISWSEHEEELTLGRESANTIELPDPTASRRHCKLVRTSDGIELQDLGSQNGTFHQGKPVSGRTLIIPGEEFTAGESTFRLEFASRAAIALPVGADVHGAPLHLLDTIRVAVDHEDAVTDAAPEPPTVSQLRVLVKAAQALADANSFDELAQALAESCLHLAPAERVALVLTDATVPVSWGWKRAGDSIPVSVSTTALQHVRADPQGILSNDVRTHTILAASESLSRQRVAALITVPLCARGRNLGALYLDRTDNSVAFEEDHLHSAVALARIAALAVDSLRQRERLELENGLLRLDSRVCDTMVGSSHAMTKLVERINLVARTKSRVLLTGESGTGKELVARAIHERSSRSSGPFVAINCAVLSAELFGSELFGHERGAFTNAVAQKKGKIELANGGTLFLDELGELELTLQARLLRVIQENVIDRVGGTSPISVDVRIIAATNRDLRALVSEGKFREDLFFRLNVIEIELPPLRERAEDIPELVKHFVRHCSARTGRRVRGVSPEALVHLMSHEWPGNVRELGNVIERAVVLGESEWIVPEDLPEELLERGPALSGAARPAFYQQVQGAKRQTILDAYERGGFNFTEAARLLGIHPNNLHRLVRRLDLRDELRRIAAAAAGKQ